MQLKICGLKYPDNILEVAKHSPDYLGFIFYKKSKRYVGTDFKLPKEITNNPIKKVGVFVNETAEQVLQICQKYQLDFAQLHGNESEETLRQIKMNHIGTIKVFHVDDSFDFRTMKPFLSFADMFLLDTKCPGYGGSGQKFNWKILDNYPFQKHFLLSGGIGPEDISTICQWNHTHLLGVDVNSQVEQAPGLKDLNKINKLKI